MDVKLGTKGGVAVYANYALRGQGDTPSIVITCGGHRVAEYSSSNLGPTNPDYAPDAADVDYWRSIARNDNLID